MTKISDAQKLFRNEIARDLNTLAILHDHEPQAELIEELRKVPVEDWFGMKLSCDTSVDGREVMSAALSAFSTPVSRDECDQLAVDFANIYLIHTYRAPPTESPWLDKDGLERQGPMFAVAEYYRRHGLEASDRQKRSDDHLVLQLQFLSHLLGNSENGDGLKEAARFMDEHILKWFGAFSERVAGRCQTPYYAALVTITNGYLEDLREQLVILADVPRPEPEIESAPTLSCEELEREEQRYVPGVSPSW
jgi:TorA maturation chaperone TorD